MKDKYLKEGLYYLYQHTKKCNAKAPLIEKKTTKKAKKKAKKKKTIYLPKSNLNYALN